MFIELYTSIFSGSPKIDGDACMLKNVINLHKVRDCTHFKCVIPREQRPRSASQNYFI